MNEQLCSIVLHLRGRIFLYACSIMQLYMLHVHVRSSVCKLRTAQYSFDSCKHGPSFMQGKMQVTPSSPEIRFTAPFEFEGRAWVTGLPVLRDSVALLGFNLGLG